MAAVKSQKLKFKKLKKQMTALQREEKIAHNKLLRALRKVDESAVKAKKQKTRLDVRQYEIYAKIAADVTRQMKKKKHSKQKAIDVAMAKVGSVKKLGRKRVVRRVGSGK